MKKKSSRVKSENNSSKRTSTIAAQPHWLSLFFFWYSQLSPFESGLFWGTLVSLTATVSATIGATLTLINPVSNSIAAFVGEVNGSENMAIIPDSQLSLGQKQDNWNATKEQRKVFVSDFSALQDTAIALQDTTNRPLAMDVLSYLSKRNLNNVYLSRSLSLELEETEIIFSSENFQAAKNLQKILGIGRLKPSTTGDLNSDIIIRLGEDARFLSQEDSFIQD